MIVNGVSFRVGISYSNLTKVPNVRSEIAPHDLVTRRIQESRIGLGNTVDGRGFVGVGSHLELRTSTKDKIMGLVVLWPQILERSEPSLKTV